MSSTKPQDAPDASPGLPGFGAVYDTLQDTFASGKTKSIAWRQWQLKQFWWMIEDNEKAITDALTADLGRHEMESRTCDLLGLKKDTLEHLQHVAAWAAPARVPEAGVLFGRVGRSRVRREPLGVVLVIGAWNFPFLLSLQPVVAAIAAGCCVVIKPSEMATASERVVAALVPRYLDPDALRVFTGGPTETAGLLAQYRFDHIFFTGSGGVARHIAAAAAKHLTPTTLELGGQCPALVGASAHVERAAKRIAYVKFLNSGQICLSVNHVFAHPAVYDRFLVALTHWTRVFSESGHMCHIINERHYDRLSGLLARTKGRVVRTGKDDRTTLRLAPAVVADVKMDDAIMGDELFGPICPVIKATTPEAISAINSLPRPLAMYVFNEDRADIETIQNNTLSGGVTINDTTLHAGCPGAPFGGVGASGMGYYHGRYGFLAFTHLRTVVELPGWLESVLSMRYPPYNLANKSKLAVKNTLGFRRGETLEDQVKISAAQTTRARIWRSLLVVGAASSILYWRSGGAGVGAAVRSALETAQAVVKGA